MTTHGIVISGNKSFKDGEMDLSAGVDPIALRKYLLYWDKIIYATPKNLPPNLEELDELRFLNENGKMLIVKMGFTDFKELNQPIDHFPHYLLLTKALAQVQVFEKFNKIPDHLWSIGQNDRDFQIPGNKVGNEIDALELTLSNCLPTPVDCPLEKILEFKAARRPELLRFRSAMEQIYSKVLSAEDTHRATVKAKQEIELSLIELHRVLDESKIQRIVSTVKTYVNLKEAGMINVLLPVLGAAGAGVLNIPKEIGALAGIGVNALLSATSKKIPAIDGLPDKLRDFGYLYHASNLESKPNDQAG